MKRFVAALISGILLLLMCACTAKSTLTPSDQNYSSEKEITMSSFDLNTLWDASEAVAVQLTDTGAVFPSSAGITLQDRTLKITAAGTYVLSGTWEDGQIVVSVGDTERVHLILNGLSVSCSVSSPLFIEKADKVCVTLLKDTDNVFTDTAQEQPDTDLETNINACIYAADDISFNGAGTLTVNGRNNNGIGCKNDIRISGGTYFINAAKNAIKGKNSVFISDGTLTLIAGNDGIKSTNQTDPEKGYVLITGGSTTVSAKDDGIQALTKVTISGGHITLHAADQKINCDGPREIAAGCVD